MTDSELSREPLATVDLLPIDRKVKNNAEDTWTRLGEDTWTTLMGRPNRIAIGQPRWACEEQPDDDGLLTAGDIENYAQSNHVFYRVDIDLTLLPASNCRFRSADFILKAQSASPPPPLILRLSPSSLESKHVVVREQSIAPKFSLAEPAFKVVNLGVDKISKRREEIERISVSMESFGASTPQAGWRFRLTESKDIPLNTCNLQALTVANPDAANSLVLNVVAEIDIQSGLDRWLTGAFKRDDRAEAQCVVEFP